MSASIPLPIELLLKGILPFMSLKELGILSRTSREIYRFVHLAYVPLIVKDEYSTELLGATNMDHLEMLNYLTTEQIRLACGENHIVWVDSKNNISFWNPDGYKIFPALNPKEKIVAVTCGTSHTVFLTMNMEPFSFGDNSHGQLGVGDHEPRKNPTKIIMKEKIGRIASNASCTTFLTSKTHELFMCGFFPTKIGSLDFVNQHTPKHIPVKSLEKNEFIKDMCIGGRHFLISTNMHRLFSVGERDCIGRYTRDTQEFGLVDSRNFPRKTSILKISSGYSHSLVLFGNGAVFCFGKSANGELGLARFQDSPIPQQIPDLPPAISIFAGKQHSVVIAAAPKTKLFTFGLATHGQLGYTCSFWSSCQPRECQLPDKSHLLNLAAAGAQFTVFANPLTKNLVIFGDFGSDGSQFYYSKKISTIELAIQ